MKISGCMTRVSRWPTPTSHFATVAEMKDKLAAEVVPEGEKDRVVGKPTDIVNCEVALGKTDPVTGDDLSALVRSSRFYLGCEHATISCAEIGLLKW
ncbi:hypothetical protein [Mesorhizobium argentiipisi]|uniref:Uncharacterized protein n=1 Tax=Mesorhizobium argentiipisi TaxID=3015175 RepID=A0ABU8K585_9HYPH